MEKLNNEIYDKEDINLKDHYSEMKQAISRDNMSLSDKVQIQLANILNGATSEDSYAGIQPILLAGYLNQEGYKVHPRLEAAVLDQQAKVRIESYKASSPNNSKIAKYIELAERFVDLISHNKTLNKLINEVPHQDESLTKKELNKYYSALNKKVRLVNEKKSIQVRKRVSPPFESSTINWHDINVFAHLIKKGKAAQPVSSKQKNSLETSLNLPGVSHKTKEYWNRQNVNVHKDENPAFSPVEQHRLDIKNPPTHAHKERKELYEENKGTIMGINALSATLDNLTQSQAKEHLLTMEYMLEIGRENGLSQDAVELIEEKIGELQPIAQSAKKHADMAR